MKQKTVHNENVLFLIDQPFFFLHLISAKHVTWNIRFCFSVDIWHVWELSGYLISLTWPLFTDIRSLHGRSLCKYQGLLTLHFCFFFLYCHGFAEVSFCKFVSLVHQRKPQRIHWDYYWWLVKKLQKMGDIG